MNRKKIFINIEKLKVRLCECNKQNKNKVRLTHISIKPKRKVTKMDPIIVNMKSTDEVFQTLQYGKEDGTPKKVDGDPAPKDLLPGINATVTAVREYTDPAFPGKTGTEIDVVASIEGTEDGDYPVKIAADPDLGEGQGELDYDFIMRIGSDATAVRQSRIVVRPKTPPTS